MPRSGSTLSSKPIGQRRTTQRDAIIAVIREARRPLTVQEIHELASAKTSSVGIATVYRALKLLLKKGEIKTVALPDSETRYELKDLDHHHHFQCLSCESVFDIEHCPITVPEGTTFPDGFRLEGHEVTLYGTCPGCNED